MGRVLCINGINIVKYMFTPPDMANLSLPNLSGTKMD